jgi:hypothetical protein
VSTLRAISEINGDAAGLVDARRTENCKMPADEIVDVDVDGDREILLQIADMRVGAVGGSLDVPQLALAQQRHGIG